MYAHGLAAGLKSDSLALCKGQQNTEGFLYSGL